MGSSFLLAGILLVACDSSQPSSSAPEVQTPAPAQPAPPLSSAQKDQVLAPSPLSLEAKVREAGLTGGLAALVPERSLDMKTMDKDRIAMRTGVVLADTVLTGGTTDKATFLAQLGTLRDGMKSLGTGQGLLAMIEDFISAVENDAAAREDFLQELDAVASTMVPEHGWGQDDTSGPLLQAGAWLAGTNLVARAIVAQERGELAETLLRNKDVADYFRSYLKGEGAAKVSGSLAAPLDEALGELSEISGREHLGIDDAREVVASTDKLLGLI